VAQCCCFSRLYAIAVVVVVVVVLVIAVNALINDGNAGGRARSIDLVSCHSMHHERIVACHCRRCQRRCLSSRIVIGYPVRLIKNCGLQSRNGFGTISAIQQS